MKCKLFFVVLVLLFSFSSYAQTIVGTYHSNFYNQDLNVELDCKEAKFAGKDITKKEYPKKIYLQVYTADLGKKAFIEFSTSAAKKFGKELLSRYNAMKTWAKSSNKEEKSVKDSEVTLFFSTFDEAFNKEIVGCETGQDYTLYFIKDNKGERVYYRGEAAKNEGKTNISISGWGLVITSLEEVQQIDNLLNKAAQIK